MKRSIFVFGIILLLSIPSSAFPGSLDSPNDPASGSGMPTLEGIYNQLDTGTAAGTAGTFQEPSSGPTAGTGRTLSEIQGKLPVLDDTNGASPSDVLSGKTFWGLLGGFWGVQTGTMATQTLSATSETVNAGYYNATTLSAVDPDLAAEKIRCGVTLFGIIGTHGTGMPECVAKTGQTTSYAPGDDGDYQKGCDPPVAPNGTYKRQTLLDKSGCADGLFTDNGDGTMTDNLTGLIWLKKANCTFKLWADALTFANSLYDGWTGDSSGGDCGLADGSSAGDWRLPNINELRSLINTANPFIWLQSQGFTIVLPDFYWSSTTFTGNTDYAWFVNMNAGGWSYVYKGHPRYAWPVRGGQ